MSSRTSPVSAAGQPDASRRRCIRRRAAELHRHDRVRKADSFTPVPEPTSLVLVAVGLLSIRYRRRAPCTASLQRVENKAVGDYTCPRRF
ncbi:MAG: hypothetical protein DMG80_09890 [Acidobacteria bacterium]|nr:MAG: hypothetical protein DMG80_09890 [Acidobacteriota bacterium]